MKLSNYYNTLQEKQKEIDKQYFIELGFCETFLNEGKEVYLVELDGKDPSELGFHHFTHLIQATQPLSFSGLLEKKIELI